MKSSLIVLFSLFFLVLTGCSTAEAEKVADDFHKKLDERDYDYILNNLVDLDGSATKDDWAGFLEIVDGWGPQTKRDQKSGFSKKINNGVTTVKLSYTFEVEEYGLVHERIVLIDYGQGYKLHVVLMDSKESVVKDGTRGF